MNIYYDYYSENLVIGHTELYLGENENGLDDWIIVDIYANKDWINPKKYLQKLDITRFDLIFTDYDKHSQIVDHLLDLTNDHIVTVIDYNHFWLIIKQPKECLNIIPFIPKDTQEDLNNHFINGDVVIAGISAETLYFMISDTSLVDDFVRCLKNVDGMSFYQFEDETLIHLTIS